MAVLAMTTLVAHAQEENMETILDIHHVLAYLVATFLISVFLMVFFNRIIYYREKDVTKASKQLIAQLSLIMDANKTDAWTYDIEKNFYTLLTDKGNSEKTYAPIDFSQYYDRDDFSELIQAIYDMRDGLVPTKTLRVKSAMPREATEEQRTFEITISILRKNRKGRPTIVVGTQRDITEEQARTENTKKLMLRYQTVFESSLVDMIFYDANGNLTQINEKAMETFGVTDRKALLKQRVKITDIPSYRDIDIHAMEPTQLSSITDIDEVKQKDERVPQAHVHGKMYYEADLSPIFDNDHNIQGVIVAGRNITDMVESNHHQKRGALLLEKRTKEIQEYIQNINYSLKVSDVRLINYYPDTHVLEVSSDLNHVEYKLPQLRAFIMLHSEERNKAERLFCRMDRRHPGSFSETFHTIMRDKEGRDVYLNFQMMPIENKEGQITHYMGMCRNQTEMTYTEKRLREETAKAQEAEQLKNTFLLNMSYELRTPLNAVIGFAELFGAEHSEEDEPIFAEEIKKNTNALLKLINDILFLSRLDARMIEFNYEDTDFAVLFDGWCYMGWSGMNPSVKTVVENPYNSMLVKIDQQNLGMVIQKICIYSALNTREGIVRAKYEYRHGELMITIEDSGNGMDAQALQKAFERFAREDNGENSGTGLDLPIVKELVEQMNGAIELQSEPGKGSTFFVSIPCEMTSMEKKSEIII